MFQTIKDNVAIVAIALLTIAVIASGAMWAITAGQLSTANANLANAVAAKTLLQSDLDNATAALKAAEIEKERLRLDAKLTAETLTVREQGRNKVATVLQDTTAKANAVIEDSPDEAIKQWANGSVPNELNQLLKRAADCANRHRQHDAICHTTKRTAELLPSARLQRQDKQRVIPLRASTDRRNC